MSAREVQIDGVTGNPIGGVQSTYNSNTYAVGSSAVGSSAVGNSGLVGQSGQYGYQTTTHVAQPTTTSYTTTSPAYGYTTGAGYGGASSYGTTGYTATSGGYGATTYGTTGYTTTTQHQHVEQYAPHIVNTVVNTGKEVIKGESRIEYVPFEKKIVEYREEARVERVPKTRKITQYRE